MAKSKQASTSAIGSESPKKNNASGAVQLQSGFLAVPLAVPSTADVKHWIYVRQHTSSQIASTSKIEELPGERTMFIANLPVDASEEWVRGVFGKVGGVSRVQFRRQTVEEDEDEREELGVGEADDEEEGEEHHQLTPAASGGKKKRPKQELKKSRVPRITPLPTMDPREAVGGQPLLSTASSAHVVFLDTLSLTRAMDLLRKTTLRWPSTPAPTGLPYLLTQYALSRPPFPSIASWANSRIALHTYRLAHPLPRRLGVRGVTLGPSGELLDEDGFIIVQRTTGKYGRAGAAADAGGSVGIAKGGYEEGKNGKRKSEGLEDFYRFQVRERKREELKELRVRFEKDKERVERLKAGRRFRPY